MSLMEVPILGSVLYGRHFVDLEEYGKDYDVPSWLPRRLPYGEDVVEHLLECGDEPLVGRDGEIRLAVRMPSSPTITFHTRKEICENLPSRKFILAEATGTMWQDDNGSFNLVVNGNHIWLGRCEESAVIRGKLKKMAGDVKVTALFPGTLGHQHAFIRIEKGHSKFGDVIDLIHLNAEETTSVIRRLKLKPSSGD